MTFINCYSSYPFIHPSGALTYAELGTLIPKSGAEYTYLYEAYSPLSHKVGQIPAFLFAWMTVMVLRPASIAIITLSFATYCLEPFYEVCDASESAKKCLAALLICECWKGFTD